MISCPCCGAQLDVDLAECDMYELEDFLSNGKHAEEKIVGNRG